MRAEPGLSTDDDRLRALRCTPKLEEGHNQILSADLAFPQTRGERPEKFSEARQFEAALFRAAVADPVVHRAMLEVAQLLERHQRLREPDIMHRIEAVSATAAA